MGDGIVAGHDYGATVVLDDAVSHARCAAPCNHAVMIPSGCDARGRWTWGLQAIIIAIEMRIPNW